MTETMREEADRLDEEAAKLEHQGTLALSLLRAKYPELTAIIGVVERHTQETPRELRAKAFELRQRIEQCAHEELLWTKAGDLVTVQCMQCGKRSSTWEVLPGLSMGHFARNVFDAFYGPRGSMAEGGK